MKKTKFYHNEQRKWVLIDARDKVLGRLSTRIARILTGKNKSIYTPNALCGDKVVVINANHIRITGKKKIDDKVYDRYSGYPSGRKEITMKELMAKNPSRILYSAVRGMVPKNYLGKRMLRSLKIYPEDQHKHQAQKPQNQEV